MAGRLAALSALVVSLAAQGPAYRERWGYLHVERRRAEVLDELRGRDARDWEKVGALLMQDGGGVPFRPVADALAYLRGVEADAAFQLRCALGLFVLPEVVDPDGSQPACRSANFSVHLPFSLPAAGAMAFEVTVRDGDGEVVFEQLRTEKVSISDVRLAQVEVAVPGRGFEDGAYEVTLRTLLDGEGPRATDPTLRWRFHVLRGYQRRAELAMAKAAEVRAELSVLPKALLDGFATRVARAYGGEAFAVESDAVQELLRLERCLENLAASRAPLLGIDGAVPTALPGGDLVQACVLRANDARTLRPTVAFASGAPSYGVGSRRPAAPRVRDARWLLRELGDFGRAEGWNLAVFDSPGGGRPYAASLLASLQALAGALPSSDLKPLLVCDREAAAVVGLQAAKFRPWISGLVLVGGGAMPAPVLERLHGLPVRFVSLSAYPASRSIERLLEYVEGGQAGRLEGLDFGMLHRRQSPWPYGPASSLGELRAFARELFADK